MSMARRMNGRSVPTIVLEHARPEQQPAIENMFQLYTHDFSEQWWDRADGELREDGRFAPYNLDPYWKEPGRIPLVLRLEERLVGFALLDDRSHTASGALDRNMAEFFIARKHRRSGVGTAAAQAIFSAYPGRWEADVARRNAGALAFWRNAIATHPNVSEISETDVANALWNGWVLRFRVGG